MKKNHEEGNTILSEISCEGNEKPGDQNEKGNFRTKQTTSHQINTFPNMPPKIQLFSLPPHTYSMGMPAGSIYPSYFLQGQPTGYIPSKETNKPVKHVP